MLKRFRALPRWRRNVILGAAGAYVALGLSGGCAAHRRPPALSGEERALVDGPPLPYSATVAWWDEETKTGQDPGAYAGSLAKLVEEGHLFQTSRYERSSAPVGQDLVATSTGLYCNTAVLPALSVLSIGVIPTIWEDEQCEGMLLRKAAGRPKTEGVQIEIRFKGPVIMGWAAVVVGAMPGWAYGAVESDPRFADRFKLAVVRRRADIERLVGR
jgi:hypothetical protein